MKKLSLLLCLSFSVSAELPSHTKELIKLDNGYYSILYNCEMRGYEHFYYASRPDTGNAKRKSSFFQDERLPKHCQQKSTYSYKTTGSDPNFDRGHGISYNSHDFDADVAYSTNAFSNIVPQSAPLNRRGLWRHTEKLVECHRDNGTVQVYGGVIWGNDASNDLFIDSHGVVTPDYLYKIIEKTNGDRNAWIMPNDPSPKASDSKKYLVPVTTIEKLTGVVFNELKNKGKLADREIILPKYCDFS